jgi:hypothetical protein
MTDLELFRDYWDNWLTVDAFASFYGLTREQAETSIARGRDQHNAIAAWQKMGNESA